MTWAKNYADRFSASETSGKRAKSIDKLCAAGCGAIIAKRKTYCGPCYDVRLQQNIAKNREIYKTRKE